MYALEAPDFWWTIDLESLQIHSPKLFRLEMEVLDDSEFEFEVRNITKWRTQLVVTQPVILSPESNAIVMRLKDCPSLEKSGTFDLLDTPMQGLKNLYSYSWVTPAFWAEMRSHHAEIDQFSFKILNCLFWRLGVHCGPSNLGSDFLEMRYSSNGEHFEILPARIDFKAETMPHKSRPTENPKLQNAANFLGSNSEAPIHHVLFREAWKCRESENRVSVVMATAAAEAAVKNLVGALMPDTIWLLENTQSPPVVKIVTELFPKLPVKCSFSGVALSPPENTVEMLKRIITSRNKIVHGSPPPMPPEKELEKWLLAVRDLLWLTDYYNGHEWALEHISPASLQELQDRAK
jgi:hypothetical protein